MAGLTFVDSIGGWYGTMTTHVLAQAAPIVPAIPTTSGQYAMIGVVSSLIVFPILSFGERQYQKLKASHEAERQRVDQLHQNEKNSLMEMLRDERADSRKIHERMGAIEATLKQYETQVTALTQKVTSLETQNLSLVGENTTLRTYAKKQELKIKQLADDLTISRKDLADERAAAAGANARAIALQQQVDTLQTSCKQLAEENTLLKMSENAESYLKMVHDYSTVKTERDSLAARLKEYETP